MATFARMKNKVPRKSRWDSRTAPAIELTVDDDTRQAVETWLKGAGFGVREENETLYVFAKK